MTVFFGDFDATVTFTTHVPDFTATIFPAFTLQYLAEDFGTDAVILAPRGTEIFAVFAILANVAGFLAVSTPTPDALTGAGDTGKEGTTT